jgi:L-amino acid N-acyltransferase YncA
MGSFPFALVGPDDLRSMAVPIFLCGRVAKMKIRDAERNDLQAIVAIYNSTVPLRMVTADTEPVSVESRAQWFEEHKPAFRPLWVAEENGEVTGWLSFSSFYGRPAYDRTAEVSIYVHTKHQRARIGSSLLKEAILQAPRLGLNTLLGFVFAHNLPSIRFFKRFGFRKWGHLPRVAVLDGIERDLVILGLRLDKQKPG